MKQFQISLQMQKQVKRRSGTYCGNEIGKHAAFVVDIKAFAGLDHEDDEIGEEAVRVVIGV